MHSLPSRYRIRFSYFSTAQTGWGIKQHFMMWELIKRERLSRGFGWGRELAKGRQTQWNCSRFGEQTPLEQEGISHNLLFQVPAEDVIECSHWLLLACSLGIRWRQWCYLSIPELPQTVAMWRHSGGRINVRGKTLAFFSPVILGLKFLFSLIWSRPGPTLLFLEAHLPFQ